MEDRLKWLLVTAIAPIAWGSTYLVTKEFLPADAPLWGAAFRAVPAGLLLLVLARRLPRGSWWWKSTVLGVLNVGAFFVLVYLSAQLLPSSIASTVMAASPGVIMLVAWPLLRQTPKALSAIGAVIGFIGVIVMLSPGGERIEPLGVAAALTAMLSSSVGFVLARRWGGASDVPLLASTAWQVLIGGLLLLPVAALTEGAPPALDLPEVLAFAYLSIVCTAIAYVAWFSGLARLPAAVVGVVGLLNPVTGVLLGILVAGEAVGTGQVIGIVLVLAGVVVGTLLEGAIRRRVSPSAPADTPGTPPETSETKQARTAP